MAEQNRVGGSKDPLQNGDDGNRKMQYLGKKLTYVLRYGAEREGLNVDSRGFVSIKQMLTLRLLRDYDLFDVVQEVETSVSMRGMKRFEIMEKNGEHYVRASYGRRMDRSAFHDGSKVTRLLETCVQTVCRSVNIYDFRGIEDNYLLNLIMRAMKRNNQLTGRNIQQFFSSHLSHVDLWRVYVSEGTLKAMAKQCPNITHLTLRDCGYVVTDQIMAFMVKRLTRLQSLNLSGCRHVTYDTLRLVAKNCVDLRHINLTFVQVLPENLVTFIRNCKRLQELYTYDYSGLTEDHMCEILEATKGRDFKIETAQTAKEFEELGDGGGDRELYDSHFERPNFR